MGSKGWRARFLMGYPPQPSKQRGDVKSEELRKAREALLDTALAYARAVAGKEKKS